MENSQKRQFRNRGRIRTWHQDTDQYLQHPRLLKSIFYWITLRPISPRQWGFKESGSTISALIKVIDDWSCALDHRKEVCVVLFDVSIAFDKGSTPSANPTAWRSKSKSIPNKTAQILYTYRIDFRLIAAIEREMSNKQPVISGVPQESILGPLLFITYINNVISPGSEINMFADDIALYRIFAIPNDYVMIREDISAISSFLDSKYLDFNESKCCTMHISRKRSNWISLPPPQLSIPQFHRTEAGENL